MKRFDKIAFRIFIYELPLLFIFIISCQLLPLEQLADENSAVKVWYDFGGLVILGSWACLAIYFSCKMLLSTSFRQLILFRITFMRERDEREVFLTGQAAKNTMLTTLAILIFLFCLSCFNFSYTHTPAELAVNGKESRMSWGIGFGLTNDAQANITENADKKNADISYEYNGLPVSTQEILLGLIIWQIVSYNRYMKRH